jgi:hypothetical protein
MAVAGVAGGCWAAAPVLSASAIAHPQIIVPTRALMVIAPCSSFE